MNETEVCIPLNEAQERLEKVDEEVRFLKNHVVRLNAAIQRIEKAKEALPTLRDRNDWELDEQYNEALTQARHGGVSSEDGTSDHLGGIDMAGKPGLIQARRLLKKRSAEADALRAHLDRWKDETMTLPYRFVGTMGISFFDGHQVEVGEVLQLNRSQAFNLRDRVEPVKGKVAKEKEKVTA